MGYGLGVDLGTTFTAAAVERDGRVEMATLGDRTAAVPSVVLLRADGTVLTGDAADRRASTEPDRVAREVKRRLGDPMPVILGGTPQPVQELMAMQLRDVVRAVAEREGGPADTVTLTHPANWGPYKRELFGQIPVRAGLADVRMLTEPEAAAAHYASTERVPDGAVVAVYDLGGGTFDATVLRVDPAGRRAGGFEILGTPEGIEGLGGIDFDEAVFAHVDRVLDGAVSALDPADVRATGAAIRLRQECVLAKEALSADTETTIPVLLPAIQTEVRLTRGELEDMIRPSVAATVESMRRALASAGVTADELHTVLLVGGSSRIPAVARTVSSELGRPTSVDAHPKHAIALGAAAVSGRTATATEAAAVGVAGAYDDVPGDDTPTPPGGIPVVGPGPGAGVPIGPGAPVNPGAPVGTGAYAVPAAFASAGLAGAAAGPDTATAAMAGYAADGSEQTMPASAVSGPGALAAGAPPPSLAAPAGPRRRRRIGIAVGGGVLVAAAAVAAALFYGAASGSAPEGPVVVTPSATPVVATTAPPEPVEPESPVQVTDEPTAEEPAPDDGAGAAAVAPDPAPAVAPAPDPVVKKPTTRPKTETHPSKTHTATSTPKSTETSTATTEPDCCSTSGHSG